MRVRRARFGLILGLAAVVGATAGPVVALETSWVPPALVRLLEGDARHPRLMWAARIITLSNIIEDPLDRVVAISAEVTAETASALDVEHRVPALRGSRSARDAITAFLVARGARPRPDLERLDVLAPALDAALARVVDAFSAFASADEVGAMLGARQRLVGAAASLTRVATVPHDGSGGTVLYPPWLWIDLEGSDTFYAPSQNYMLSIDLAGDDTYHNAAGGTGGSPSSSDCFRPIFDRATAIDVAGNDQYGEGSDCGRNGGAAGGSFTAGLLFDGAGADRYWGGRVGINGGGGSGHGSLIDAVGDDDYTAGSTGTNGGSWSFGGLSSGSLIDGAGSDRYEGGGGGTNGGSRHGYRVGEGHAVLVDAGGDDRYTAGGEGTNGGAHAGMWGSFFGAAASALIDVSGDDQYRAGDLGTNGGVAAGADWNFIEASSAFASGLLVDGAGNDSYTAGRGGNGGAFADTPERPPVLVGARGALIDLAGNDSYVADSGGNGAAALPGPLPPTTNQLPQVGLGLLYDGLGADWYSDPLIPGGTASDCSMVAKGGAGMQVDVPGLPCGTFG